MPKAKDGSECYTRINKSGGKYITCEGTQKGSKGKKVTPKKMKKEDEVRPVDKKVPKLKKPKIIQEKKGTVKKEIDFKKIKDILKKSGYHFRVSMRIKDNKLMVGSSEDDIEKLIKDMDKLFKNKKLVYDNVIFMTNSYPPNPKTGKQDGVYRKPKMIFKGERLYK